METGPAVVAPNRSRAVPSESTIVARTLIVPSLAMAALWIFTTTPVFPSELVVPLSLAMVEKSTARWTLRSWADAIIDDFAHHPTAIAETLKALHTRYAGRRLWAILEPRSNTLRRKVFQDELARSLSLADEVVVAAIFKSEAIPEHERLDAAAVIAKLRASGKPARLLDTADAMVDSIGPELRTGDVVASLSSGGFAGIYEKLPARLRALHEVATPA